MGPRSNLLSQKNGQKSRDTVPLRMFERNRVDMYTVECRCSVWVGFILKISENEFEGVLGGCVIVRITGFGVKI